jgi:uncharacterized protein YegP (UPF0339 family)
MFVPQRPAPSFLIFQDTNGNWRWNFVGQVGRVIAASTVGYLRREGCINAIQTMKGIVDVPVLLANQPQQSAAPEPESAPEQPIEPVPEAEPVVPADEGPLDLERKQILH